ncbi:hypothetical protein AJ88_44185 [Mesorhizobium amorphae CCBAU 01583]|nr:hypothetical protein AJ88_44185 [Mesorhizobium amorphae CCBAU 01583]
MARASTGGTGPAEQNSRAVLVRRDDTRCSIRQVVSPIMNERAEFCGLVIVFQDFTDARALQRQLAYAAAHDALTGLANRSSFIRTMEELVDRSGKADAADTTGPVAARRTRPAIRQGRSGSISLCLSTSTISSWSTTLAAMPLAMRC